MSLAKACLPKSKSLSAPMCRRSGRARYCGRRPSSRARVGSSVTGAHGGWFDASQLRYRIVRSTDGVVLTEDLTACSYTDGGYTSPADRQGECMVSCICRHRRGPKPLCAELRPRAFGKPYAAPVSETFAGADMALYPWMSQSSNAVMQAWSLDPAGLNPPAADQNGDRGLATFHMRG